MASELKQLKEKLLRREGFRKNVEKQDLSFEIAETIIDARIKRGMTQKELASKLKTKQSGIARLENGRHKLNLQSLERIAKILKIKLRNPLVLEEVATLNFNMPVSFFTGRSAPVESIIEYKNEIVSRY